MCDASLRRYGKQTRLQDQLNKMPMATREFGDQVWERLPEFLVRAASGQAPMFALPDVQPTKQAKRPREAPVVTRRWKLI